MKINSQTLTAPAVPCQSFSLMGIAIPLPQPAVRAPGTFICRQCLTLLLVLIIPSSAYSLTAGNAAVHDFRQIDFGSAKPFEMTGEWNFYWKKFITTDEGFEESVTVKVPANWTSYQIPGGPVSETGYATFRTRILLPETESNLAIYLPRQIGALRIELNGRHIRDIGRVAASREDYIITSRPEKIILPMGAKSIDLIIHAANYDYRKGGILSKPLIGDERKIQNLMDSDTRVDMFFMGLLFILFIYNLALFIYIPQNRSLLYFSIFCLLGIMRIAATGQSMFLATTFQWITFETARKIEYIAFINLLPAFYLFIHSIYPDEDSPLVRKALLFIAAPYTLLVLFGSSRTYGSFALHYEIIILIAVVYLLFVVIRAMVKKLDGALLFFLGLIAILLATTNDILHNEQVVHTVYIIHYAIVFLFVMLTVIVAGDFARTYKLEEKTIELGRANRELADANKVISTTLDTINRDLETARIIQRNLLPPPESVPSHLTVSSSYLPYDRVGGDIYSWLTLDSGVFRVIVADAMGHGVQAALITMMINDVFTMFAAQSETPADLHTRMNDYICRNNVREKVFFTSVIADICQRDNLVTLSNAGHHAQLLQLDGTTQSVYSPGRIMGIDHLSSYRNTAYAFPPGARLLLFTDGVFEYPYGSDPSFGLMRFMELIERNSEASDSDILSLCCSDGDITGVQGPYEDDRTMLCITARGE